MRGQGINGGVTAAQAGLAAAPASSSSSSFSAAHGAPSDPFGGLHIPGARRTRRRRLVRPALRGARPPTMRAGILRAPTPSSGGSSGGGIVVREEERRRRAR
eukprot:scaffold1300_cov317-Prasinococcus_capsulatus_cf.AAC.13